MSLSPMEGSWRQLQELYGWCPHLKEKVSSLALGFQQLGVGCCMVHRVGEDMALSYRYGMPGNVMGLARAGLTALV